MQIPLSEKRLGLFYVLIVEQQSECAFFRASTSVAALFLLTRKDRKSIETIDSNVIGIEDNFFLDLGGNSLDYFSLVGLIKEQLMVAIPMEEIQTLSTIKEIGEYIQRRDSNEL